jgi:O-antigen/teichoic acid export membrane protein
VALMLGGTLLVGLSGYLFLALIGHGRFDAATTAALSATYLIGNVLGPGVFVALEQETSRVVSDGLARGVGGGRGTGARGALTTRVRRMSAIGGGLALATLLVLVAFAPLLLDRVLDGRAGLILALALAVVGSAAVYLVRGLTGGQQRFRRYAMTVLIDGAARIVGCLTLVAVGSTDPVAYAMALCAGPGVAALLTARRAGPAAPAESVATSARSSPEPGSPAIPRLVKDVGLLLVASALAMVLANLAPVVVTAALPGDPVTAAGFAGAVVLTRVPLLFMGTISALLLPGMTAAAAVDDRSALASTVLRGLAVIGGIGLVAMVGTWAIGRPVLAILFGADRDTTSTTALVWLTASAAVFMAVQLLQPALVAVRRHRALVWAWVAGSLAFAGCFVLPLAPLPQGVLAQVVGPCVTLAVQLVVIGRYLRG